MTEKEFINIYIKQYNSIENDFLTTDDFVAIHSSNYSTFSNQYLKLHLMICSEIDSLLCEFCKVCDYKNSNIVSKMDCAIKKYSNLKNAKVTTNYKYNSISLVPFSKFSDNVSAEWWQNYNLLKHNRSEKNESGRYNYQNANLKNVLYAISALYILHLTISNDLYDNSSNECLKSKLFEDKISI